MDWKWEIRWEQLPKSGFVKRINKAKEKLESLWKEAQEAWKKNSDSYQQGKMDAYHHAWKMISEAQCPISETNFIDHPSHYTGHAVECIDAIEAATEGLNGFEGYCAGNVIKYVWRWKRKGGIEDLKKARWYLDQLIDAAGGTETDAGR